MTVPTGCRAGRQPGHPDLAARHHRGRQERECAGQVRFDDPVPRGDPADTRHRLGVASSICAPA